MNHGGRIGLLSCAVVLLVVGVICLRQRIGPVNAPPAFVPSSERGAEPRGGTADHPTILSPDPHSEAGVLPAAPWQVPGAGPPSTLFPLPPTYPVNTEVAPPAGGPGNDPPAFPSACRRGIRSCRPFHRPASPPRTAKGCPHFRRQRRGM